MRGSRVIGMLLAGCLALMPLVPPAHAHGSIEHEDHQPLVHRHAAAYHHPDGHAHHPDHHPIIDHDESAVVLDTATYDVPTTRMTLLMAPSPLAALAAVPEAESQWLLHFIEHLIHAPPRVPASPRAPPALPTT